MSIANELTRIQNAKSAIANSIKNKGVTVPATTKLDGMAALIGQIQQGSSLETSTLSSGSGMGGTTYYIDESGQGKSYKYYNEVTALRGSYFILDFADQADGFYLAGCEIVRAYGPVATTVDLGTNNYVIILKITSDTATVMI